MAVSLSPLFNPDSAQIDANGAPRSGALLFTYLAGTSIKTTTYKTSSGSGGASHTNPIILDSNGLPPAPIWLTQSATYKFVLCPSTDTDPPASAILTIDNITGINDVADVVATEWTPSGLTPTYISWSAATSTGVFSVPTDQTTLLNVNRRIKLITTSSATVYASITKSTYTSLTTVTVLLDSGALDTGINTLNPLGVQYGIVSAANTSLPFLSRDQQCGRLVYVSATQIRLDPVDGNTIWIYTGAAGWTRRTIPSAGITAANTSIYLNGSSPSNLSTDTFYYVYLFDNSGVPTVDFSTTAPAVDATSGLKIKTGDATRLLIGMVRTKVASNQFDTPGLVLSWYRRRAISCTAALTTDRTTTSGSTVEINAEIQVRFLTWAEEAVSAQFTGYADNDTSGQTHTTAIYYDGVSTTFSAAIVVKAPGVSYMDNVSIGGSKSLTEGYHYLTVGVSRSANQAKWYSGATLYEMTKG